MSISTRGRPKSSNIPALKREGEQRDAPWKCKYCSRIFPRKKSLTAHERTHTGEKPYPCKYPSCQDAFKQSGQLKTHERCHTGEKPFACKVSGCTERFAHSNRKCSVHSTFRLVRDGKEEIHMDNMTDEVNQWLKGYKEKKEKPTKRKRVTKSEDAVKQKCPSPTQSTSSGVSSSSAQEEERIPDEAQGGERQLQVPDSEAIEAARILCSFSSGATSK